MPEHVKEKIARILKEECERIKWGHIVIDATVQDGEITVVQYETKRSMKT